MDAATGYTMLLNASVIETCLRTEVTNDNNDNTSAACLHFIFVPGVIAVYTGQETHLFSMIKLAPCLTEVLSFQ